MWCCVEMLTFSNQKGWCERECDDSGSNLRQSGSFSNLPAPVSNFFPFLLMYKSRKSYFWPWKIQPSVMVLATSWNGWHTHGKSQLCSCLFYNTHIVLKVPFDHRYTHCRQIWPKSDTFPQKWLRWEFSMNLWTGQVALNLNFSNLIWLHLNMVFNLIQVRLFGI